MEEDNVVTSTTADGKTFVVKCSDVIERFEYCSAAATQFNYIRHFGVLESCEKIFSDIGM